MSPSRLYSEFIAGRSLFDWLFLLLGIAVQVVVFCLQPDEPIAVISGIAGIISVILCAQGKISTFFFGFIQISTYLYLSLIAKFYGEVAINAFYFCSQIYGIIVWKRNYHITKEQSAELSAKRLSTAMMLLLSTLCLLLSCVVGYYLQNYTDDSQPWLDAFTTVPALFAQILLMLAYREQWLVWLLVDVLSAIMWARQGEYCMLAQYIFWCANCIYGWRKWSMSTTQT